MFGRSKKKPTPPKRVEFGRYLQKPVVGRAMEFITGLGNAYLLTLVATRQLKLNGKLVDENGWMGRLESGQYVIERVDGGASWRFFIA